MGELNRNTESGVAAIKVPEVHIPSHIIIALIWCCNNIVYGQPTHSHKKAMLVIVCRLVWECQCHS